MQTLAEMDIAMVVVGEPYRVPDQDNWFGDLHGTELVIANTCLFPYMHPYTLRVLRRQNRVARVLTLDFTVSTYFNRFTSVPQIAAFFTLLAKPLLRLTLMHHMPKSKTFMTSQDIHPLFHTTTSSLHIHSFLAQKNLIHTVCYFHT